MFDIMIKTISKIGNSQGIMLDAALMDLARLKVGDQVNLTVHEGGAIYLTPVHPVVAPDEAAVAARRTIAKNRELFRRLA
jgi:antitoxin component of MazEF toxin-antitoxin module